MPPDWKSCMPELPEVQTVVTTLRPQLIGRRIESVLLVRTDIVQPPGKDLAAALLGRSFGDVHRAANESS